VAAALFALLPIGQALGAEQWAGGKINFVYPLADGNFIVTLAVDSPLCPSPGTPKYMYAVVGQNGVTAAGLKNLYASLLAAHLSARTVSIAFDDSTGACYINRLAVN
jgi:hypothetical protein